MKLSKIKAARMTEIEDASHGHISFKVLDGVVTGVNFPGPFGQIYVELSSYAVNVCEIATKQVYHLSFFLDAADQRLFIEKEFPTEAERGEYIRQYLSLVPEDEMTLQTREVQDD